MELTSTDGQELGLLTYRISSQGEPWIEIVVIEAVVGATVAIARP